MDNQRDDRSLPKIAFFSSLASRKERFFIYKIPPPRLANPLVDFVIVAWRKRGSGVIFSRVGNFIGGIENSWKNYAFEHNRGRVDFY